MYSISRKMQLSLRYWYAEEIIVWNKLACGYGEKGKTYVLLSCLLLLINYNFSTGLISCMLHFSHYSFHLKNLKMKCNKQWEYIFGWKTNAIIIFFCNMAERCFIAITTTCMYTRYLNWLTILLPKRHRWCRIWLCVTDDGP